MAPPATPVQPAAAPLSGADPSHWPLWLRVTHWLNAVAVIIMVLSGWRIYNASPFLPFVFSNDLTLGGWLGGALQWHFAAMYLLVANGAVYLTLNLLTGRARRRFAPFAPASFWRELRDAVRLRLSHHDLGQYNTIQKISYTVAILALILVVLSGLVLWKHVQFPVLRTLLGGYETARRVHFACMAVIVLFTAVHVVMAFLVPRTLRGMITGRLSVR